MRYLIFIIVFIISFYYAKQENSSEQITDDLITGIDNIENAKSVEDSIETTEKFNKNAARNFHLMKEKAKSPSSIKFVELTEKQNAFGERGMALTKKMQPLLNSLTPDVANDPDKLEKILIPLCPTLNEYINLFSGIVKTIRTKKELLNENPIISTELFNAQHTKMKELLSHLLSSQNRLLEGEKQAYFNLQCDTYQTLSNNQDASLDLYLEK